MTLIWYLMIYFSAMMDVIGLHVSNCSETDDVVGGLHCWFCSTWSANDTGCCGLWCIFFTKKISFIWV